MMGEEPAYVRPMDAVYEKRGPLVSENQTHDIYGYAFREASHHANILFMFVLLTMQVMFFLQGQAEAQLVKWLSLVIEEEGRRA